MLITNIRLFDRTTDNLIEVSDSFIEYEQKFWTPKAHKLYEEYDRSL